MEKIFQDVDRHSERACGSLAMNLPVLPTVLTIMGKLFSLPEGSLTAESSMESVEQWDSLQHINVIVDIEQHFNITMSPDEVMQLHSVQAIVDLVESKLA